jgi:hypothetical protein
MFEDEALREHSRLMFGQQHRLAVMLVIAQTTAPFTLSDVSSSVGAKHPSSLQGAMKTLHTAGLIRDVRSPAKERLYDRVESHAWQFAQELYERLRGQDSLFS